MFDDFDTLYLVLSTINPHDYVRKKVNGYAMLDSIKALRKEIEQVHTTENFYWLINRALILCQDGHTSPMRKYFYDYITDEDKQKWKSTPADTAVIDEYSRIRGERLQSVKLSLPIKYINGQYITLQTFFFNKIAVTANAILINVNGMPVHSFVRTKLQHKKDLHWDFNNHRFYADDFYNSFDIPLTDKIRFEFKAGKKLLPLSLSLADSVSAATKLLYVKDKEIKKVAYFADEKILYIRMPIMWDSAFYLQQIDSLQNVLPINSIEKVLLDVRDNAGGNDGDWVSIITRFLQKPVIRNIIKCLNPHNPFTQRIYADSFRIFKSPLIQNSEFTEAINAPDTILPYKNKLRFSGKIYVIQNENCFSATGDLISTCQFSDQLINIGNSTGWFGGFGSMPWVFILPHSKILYWTEPLIDFTNVKSPGDLFHNEVKIPLMLTTKDYLSRYSYKGDIYEQKFLLTEDPVVKRILSFTD
ncbi:MAG: hypothetical protein H7Y86_08410 [Rhizobacter sp.]|nr:hypothetical protein [Ferruginibacter sp.]